ncbi:AAA family ATPase, partial [Candidatus Pacearchaeota archaeon]|nr:AAA family ATPase [Candidatus Pacearchaeota archaeon]
QLNRIIKTAYLGGDKRIDNMLNLSANFFFDRIDDIKINADDIPVYDFTVPKDHNFIANGFIVHNSEKRIRQIFEEAEQKAPSIIFIDEIDAIAPKREETHGEVERRVVAQLLAMMDGLNKRGKVIVIGATNRPNSIDPALRRPGRFDREISFGVPNKKERLEILKIHTRNMPLDQEIKLEDLSDITHGFVGADISALAKEAAMNVIKRVLPTLNVKDEEPLKEEFLQKLIITKDDFKEALKTVRPSALREVLIEKPNVKWNDIGGLFNVKQDLIEVIEWPLTNAEAFKRLGIRPPKGVLLYGPPGCGKTLLAKAVANESQANFIQVKGPELISMWVGESEKGVRKIFEKARQASPTIVFFDEIDSIASRRGLESGAKVTERVVNQLLSEMDGLEELNDVVIIAATNRPDILDPALLRAGRFDRLIMTGTPDKESRLEIFKIHTKNMPLNKDVDLKELAQLTDGFVGADIESLCREAAIIALRKDMLTKEVTMKNFEEALQRVGPSVQEDDIKRYEDLAENYLRTARSAEIRTTTNYMG